MNEEYRSPGWARLKKNYLNNEKLKNFLKNIILMDT